jgi:hypothetical protein
VDIETSFQRGEDSQRLYDICAECEVGGAGDARGDEVMNAAWMNVLIGLQAFQVLFLALHDWVPLGRLSNLSAVRGENPGARLWVATLVSTAPFAVGLAATAFYFYTRGIFPGWVRWWVWISYSLLFAGELRAWWIPYLFGTTPERTARAKAMFEGTYAFLPERHGLRPDTLHVILHVVTAATLVVLGILSR